MRRESRISMKVKSDDNLNASNCVDLKDINQEKSRLQVYYFGNSKVTIGKEDEARYNYHNFNEGEQRGCMKLIQFTRREYIRECYFVGHNSFVAVPGWEKSSAERDSKEMHLTLSLMKAMLENDVVAICRYAPDAYKHLQLVALMPHKDKHLGYIYLKVFRLPFAEDMHPFNFVNVDSSCPKPSHKQANLIDELIDVMQFSTSSSPEPECVLNPIFQRQCTALKLKALNKNIDIGADSKIIEFVSPSEFLKRGLQPDPKLLENAKYVLSALSDDENGFILQEVTKSKRTKQEIRVEDISGWLAELESVNEENEMKNEGVKYMHSAQIRYIDRARARLQDNFDFHMMSLLDEVSVMTASEDEKANQLYEIALARLVSLRSLAIEFGTNSPTLISKQECVSSEYSESEANAVWLDLK
ncbi:hypothetical protein DICVIV_00864 [Dictyocaulus viviparus]|uniref:Ku domain-containing protein n=1 Tax=Dictyocaulus viviparus TaxID=29172 RepID=A0A0D8Y8D4_DICVI|nr:hypothetical protein DICVIV_00864 [Dictyocaulus viviparus]